MEFLMGAILSSSTNLKRIAFSWTHKKRVNEADAD
jgi:hypothetical protein